MGPINVIGSSPRTKAPTLPFLLSNVLNPNYKNHFLDIHTYFRRNALLANPVFSKFQFVEHPPNARSTIIVTNNLLITTLYILPIITILLTNTDSDALKYCAAFPYPLSEHITLHLLHLVR